MVEPVGKCRAGLGESPVWDARCWRLVWIDHPGRALLLTEPESGRTTRLALPEAPGCVALRSGGGWMVAAGRRLWTIDGAGAATPYAELDPALPPQRFNDGKPDAEGRLLVGTRSGTPGRRDGALYRCGADRRLVPLLGGLDLSNGLGWSGGRLLHVDTPTLRVTSWAELPDDRLGDGRLFHQLSPDQGKPDGLAVDAAGGIWLACWGGAQVLRLDPEGRPVGRIVLPVPLVTSCAFGGADLRKLFITTAAGEGDASLAGRLFACRVDVPGQPADVCAA